MRKTLWAVCLMAAGLLALTGCNDEESDLGLALTDPSTLWNGVTDTLRANEAVSLRTDSLRTSGYTYCIVGNYADALFGSVEATLYTQLALPTATSSINISQVSIDSVVLSLVKDQLYPDSNGSYNLHFEVKQLATPMSTDSTYYAFSAHEVEAGTLYFDSTVRCGATDTVIRLKMDESIYAILAQNASVEQFRENAKGLRIRLLADSDPCMLTLNMGAAKTCLTMYYRYDTDTIQSEYTFSIGTNSAHYNHFSHDYTTSATGGAATIDGRQRMYLEPLAGYSLRLCFDSSLRAFHERHPRAIIHYAELLLPTAPEADGNHPGQLVALSKNANGKEYYLPDLTDTYTYRGYDGHHNGNAYRIRVTEYLQGRLIEGQDLGMHIEINAQRHEAKRTVVNGPATADPARIVFTYSE